MFTHIVKRDGRVELFDENKIFKAIYNAAVASGGNDEEQAKSLTELVVSKAEKQFGEGSTPDVEGIQDIVEQVLIENGHAVTAKAYILYRQKRKEAREIDALIGATIDMFGNYLGDKDWSIKENANMQRSVN